jgi:two-component system, sensor histidine kinase PdtaS
MGDQAAISEQVCNANAGGGQLPSLLTLLKSERRTVESYERELARYRSLELRLRDALAERESRLRQQDDLIQRQELLSRESDHRLMNELQMTISLLSLQSRSTTNSEAAAQLAAAANRVSMITRIHHRLHAYDGVQAIEFRKSLEDFARDFSSMLSSDERPERVLAEGVEISLPAATAIPLGYIVSELIANAVKYGNGRIAIRLQPDPAYGYALSVSNNVDRLCRKGSTPAPARDWG